MKSKQTKAKEISADVKQKVLARQGGFSISRAWLGNDVEFHHVIKRSSGGLGIEENIVAITPEEHRDYHDGKPIKLYGKECYTNKEFETLMKNHLKIKYPYWNEQMCKYKKGKNGNTH